MSTLYVLNNSYENDYGNPEYYPMGYFSNEATANRIYNEKQAEYIRWVDVRDYYYETHKHLYGDYNARRKEIEAIIGMERPAYVSCPSYHKTVEPKHPPSTKGELGVVYNKLLQEWRAREQDFCMRWESQIGDEYRRKEAEYQARYAEYENMILQRDKNITLEEFKKLENEHKNRCGYKLSTINVRDD